jgi:hypothetical protein
MVLEMMFGLRVEHTSLPLIFAKTTYKQKQLLTRDELFFILFLNLKNFIMSDQEFKPTVNDYAPMAWATFCDDYTIVKREGVQFVKVRGLSGIQESLSPINQGGDSIIMNLAAVRQRDMAQIEKLFEEGCMDSKGRGGRGFIDRTELSKFELRINVEIKPDGSFMKSDLEDLPMKGQRIKVNFIKTITVGSENSRHPAGTVLLVPDDFSVPMVKEESNKLDRNKFGAPATSTATETEEFAEYEEIDEETFTPVGEEDGDAV